MLPPQTSQSYKFDKTTFEIIWTCSSPHEPLPQSHCRLEGQTACSVLYCSLPNFWQSSLHLQKQRPKKKVVISRRWKPVRKDWVCEQGQQREDVKSQGARKESRDLGRARAGGSKRSPERKKERKLNIQLYEEEWDAFWRFCVGLFNALKILRRKKQVDHLLWETPTCCYTSKQV